MSRVSNEGRCTRYIGGVDTTVVLVLRSVHTTRSVNASRPRTCQRSLFMRHAAEIGTGTTTKNRVEGGWWGLALGLVSALSQGYVLSTGPLRLWLAS